MSYSLSYIIAKWVILVICNAAFSFYVATDIGQANLAGICFGIFSWIVIYVYLEIFTYEQNLPKLRFSLFIGAILKIITQFYPIIEYVTGALAIAIIENTTLTAKQFLGAYLITMLDGFLLSMVMSVIVGMSLLGIILWELIRK